MSQILPPDDQDRAVNVLYNEWVADWAELRRFITDRLHDDLGDLTPRKLVLAAQGYARPHVLKPLLVAWIDRSPWGQAHHKHHHTPHLPIRGHVYIDGAPTTSWDDGHFHEVDPVTAWTEYETLDFSRWGSEYR